MSQLNFISHKRNDECSLPQPFTSGQYEGKACKTLYQILAIEFRSDRNPNNDNSKIHWETKLITKTKKDLLDKEFLKQELVNKKFSEEKFNNLSTQDKYKYKLSKETITKLKKSYEAGGLPTTDLEQYGTIGYTLPSPGCMLNKGLINTLLGENKSYSPIELNNFYESFVTLLHTRKMSQLIAKTWDATLKAEKIRNPKPNEGGNQDKKDGSLLKFMIENIKAISTENVSDLQENKKNIQADILDGLIAREIFLLSSSCEPDTLEQDSFKKVYYPLKSSSKTVPNDIRQDARFLILPNSKGWQSLGLSLLMAGQVYYYVDKDDNFLIVHKSINGTDQFFKQVGKQEFEEVLPQNVYYHQVNQSILSTGEIVMKYALDVSWNLYKGDIKEMDIRTNTSSPAYLAILPYPAIPSEINLSHEQIKEWAEAGDTPDQQEKGKNKKFPFYIENKDDNGTPIDPNSDKYLIGTQNHTPPYPYLPSSCS